MNYGRGFIMKKVLFLMSFVALSAFKTSSSMDSTDVDLNALIVGKEVVLEGENGPASLTYTTTGEYRYVSAGNVSTGKYRINGNEVCVDFYNGAKRCDRYVDSGDGYVLINRNGNRYGVISIN